MKIYCCACEKKVEAELINGQRLYPNRPDLFALPFWLCRTCHGTVGCHHKTNDPTRPLGSLANHGMTKIRRKLHEQMDPLWKGGKITRTKLYKRISKEFGRAFHISKLRNMNEAHKAKRILERIIEELG